MYVYVVGEGGARPPRDFLGEQKQNICVFIVVFYSHSSVHMATSRLYRGQLYDKKATRQIKEEEIFQKSKLIIKTIQRCIKSCLKYPLLRGRWGVMIIGSRRYGEYHFL